MDRNCNNPPMPFSQHGNRDRRRLINIMCPAVLIVTGYDLTQALNHLEQGFIAVSLFMIAVVIVG